MVAVECERTDRVTLSEWRRLRGISRDALHRSVELRSDHALLSESLPVIDGRCSGGFAALSGDGSKCVELSGQAGFFERDGAHSRIGVLYRQSWESHAADAGR